MVQGLATFEIDIVRIDLTVCCWAIPLFVQKIVVSLITPTSLALIWVINTGRIRITLYFYFLVS